MNYIFLVLCHKIHFTCEYVRRCTYGVWLRIVSVIRQKSLGVHVHIRSLWRQGGAPLKHHEETWADIRQATLNWHRVEKFSFSKRYIPELSNNKNGNLLQFKVRTIYLDFQGGYPNHLAKSSAIHIRV